MTPQIRGEWRAIMSMIKHWSDYDLKRLREMKAEKKTAKEIAQLLGRSEQAVSVRWVKMNKEEKRPYVKRAVKQVHAMPDGTAVKKPMMVFIGEPKEITAAVRELFS